MDTLIHLLFPDVALPEGGSAAYSLGHEGIAWSTAGWLFAGLALAIVWSYLRCARQTSRFTRLSLSALRLLLVAVLLLLLVRPVLVIPLKETIRRPLVVLVDTSRSMTIADQRDTAADRARAALATGLIAPDGGLDQALPAATDPAFAPTRAELLTALAANPRLNLWPRLHASADLRFFSFGQQVADLGLLQMRDEREALTAAASQAFFKNLNYREESTALGDALRDVLAKTRGQPVAGVLVITDGASNTGSGPIEAARFAPEDEVPLFIYGVGVGAPPDLAVTDLIVPPTGSVRERVDVIVRFRTQGLADRRSTLRVTADSQVIAEERLDLRTDGEQEWKFSFVPEKLGEIELTASVTPLPQEAVTTNNTRSASVRILDQRINVLLIQREPNWDFQYLLALLQRDRRVSVKCVLLQGDPGLAALPGSPFLARLPADRAGLLGYDVIILGDVTPNDLGVERQKMLHDWVNHLGGGLVFLSGSRLNANTYRGTALEPVLPVTPSGTAPAASPAAEFPLALTPAGAASPLLRLSDNLPANVAAWTAFPGVRWITPSGPARPGAQVLLIGPGSGRPGETPPIALALQSYGAGQAFYVGIGETHRWRANQGEKSYARIWLQILQAISLQREPGTSAYSQLKIERAEYFPQERIGLTARLLTADFTPLDVAEITASVRFKTGPDVALPPAPVPVRLAAVPGRPGEFAGDLPAPSEGAYLVALTTVPDVEVPFRVKSPGIEMANISLRERTLRAMAAAGGGKFLREEDLHRLPGWLSADSAARVTYKKIPLTLAPALLALLLLAAFAEWFWRRKTGLK